jgi:hypothetical protein
MYKLSNNVIQYIMLLNIQSTRIAQEILIFEENGSNKFLNDFHYDVTLLTSCFKIKGR